MGFEPKIPVFVRAKTVHALECEATVNGPVSHLIITVKPSTSKYCTDCSDHIKGDEIGREFFMRAKDEKCIYYLLTHGAEPFWRSGRFCSYSRIPQHFMEPEGSLPCSQEPSSGPYPEPDLSNPYHPNLDQ
jgi:hypothetical protein